LAFTGDTGGVAVVGLAGLRLTVLVVVFAADLLGALTVFLDAGADALADFAATFTAGLAPDAELSVPFLWTEEVLVSFMVFHLSKNNGAYSLYR
jgi:hypothetical protein